MNIYVFQIINYTLSFLMWMLLGRVVVTLITAGKQNFIIGLFRKITDPVYTVVLALFPFLKVPPEKRGGMYEAIGGCVPFAAFFLIVLLRLALIIFAGPQMPKQ